MNKDPFSERGRSLEDDYFRKKEKEVVDQMRRKVEIDNELRRLGEQAGLRDEEVLRDLQELGYTAETAMLIPIVPLIQMAWGEGTVTQRERDLVIKAARTRGIVAGSAADEQLDRWLTYRPSNELFEKTLRAIGRILQVKSPDTRAETERDMLSQATAIASASGGFVGFHTVSEEERQILAHISEELKKSGKT